MPHHFGNIPKWVREQGLCFICREHPRVTEKHCQVCLDAGKGINPHRTRDYYRKKHAERAAEGLCVKCRKPNSNGCKNCDECLEQRRNVTKELRDSGLCIGCRKPHDCEGYSYCQSCRTDCVPESAEWNLKLKLETMQAYGGVRCACCGISNHHCLNIDHANNDGSAHRRITGGGGQKTYIWLKSKGFPSGYQVLCFNCNFFKHRNGRLPTQEDLFTSVQTTPLSKTEIDTSQQFEPFVFPF